MRPVDRGPRPRNAQGQEISFSSYTKARRDLINRMGQYCSYCETRLNTSLAVEHVQPKKPDGADREVPERLLDWGNFLLACTNCNSIKGNEDVELADYLWPDQDNTYGAICYGEGGTVSPVSLEAGIEKKALKIIQLVGLDRKPDSEENPEASDRRGRTGGKLGKWLWNPKWTWLHQIALGTEGQLSERRRVGGFGVSG